jgi:transposase
MDTSTLTVATDTLGRRIARRRHRTIEEKRAIVAESLEPGASVAQVARRHGVNANLVFIWRRLEGQGLLETHSRRGSGRRLMPVKLIGAPTVPSGSAAGVVLRIELPGEIQLHVGSGADVALIERVIGLLRR